MDERTVFEESSRDASAEAVVLERDDAEGRARRELGRDQAGKGVGAEVDVPEPPELAYLRRHRAAEQIEWEVDPGKVCEVGDAYGGIRPVIPSPSRSRPVTTKTRRAPPRLLPCSWLRHETPCQRHKSSSEPLVFHVARAPPLMGCCDR